MSRSVTTTTTATTPSPGGGGLNLGYLQTIPGMLKLGQTLALLVALVCVSCAGGWPSWAAFQFFQVVVLWFLVAFLVFLLMHVCGVQRKMPCINWPLTEFFHYTVGSVLLFIASVIGVVNYKWVSALLVASVFGFIATFLMVINLWTSYSVACGAPAGGSV